MLKTGMFKKGLLLAFKLQLILFSILICQVATAKQFYDQCRDSCDSLCKPPQSSVQYTKSCATCASCPNCPTSTSKASAGVNQVQDLKQDKNSFPCCLCDSCCPLCLNNLVPDISWLGCKNISSVFSGYIFAGYDRAQHRNGNFTLGGFNPVVNFLYKDLVLAEAEIDFEITRKSKTITRLEYASLDFFLHKYVTFIAGKFLSPLGQFIQNQKPAWINKLPSRPPGFNPCQAAPESEIGLELRGGFPICDMLVNYALYVGNGPETVVYNNLIDHIAYRGFNKDEDGHKIVGGRLGFLPWPCLELGFSAAHGRTGLFLTKFNGNCCDWNTRSCDYYGYYATYYPSACCNYNDPINNCNNCNNCSNYNNCGNYFSCNPIDIRSYASYGADFSFRCDNFSFRGEYIRQTVKGNRYTLIPGNRFRSYYLQLAYRIYRFEPVIRYTNYKTFQTFYRQHQVAVGIDYWFEPSVVAKIAYEFNSSQKYTINDDNRFLFQVAYGF